MEITFPHTLFHLSFRKTTGDSNIFESPFYIQRKKVSKNMNIFQRVEMYLSVTVQSKPRLQVLFYLKGRRVSFVVWKRLNIVTTTLSSCLVAKQQLQGQH